MYILSITLKLYSNAPPQMGIALQLKLRDLGSDYLGSNVAVAIY